MLACAPACQRCHTVRLPDIGVRQVKRLALGVHSEERPYAKLVPLKSILFMEAPYATLYIYDLMYRSPSNFFPLQIRAS